MGTADTTEWACVLCDCCIQNDWASRAKNLHQILHEPWTFLCGNYPDDSEGHSYGQLVIGSFITTHLLVHHVSCGAFCWNIKSPRLLSPPTAQILYPETSDFSPKLKSPLRGKRFQTFDEIQENTMGQLMVTERTVWSPKVLTLKGTEASLSCVQCVLCLVSPSINVSIFHITWLDTFWTDLLFVWVTRCSPYTQAENIRST